MEIRVLGGLSARLDGKPLRLGTPKQQLVLARLAVEPGHLVMVDELIDELWPDGPPRSAVANVRTYAANLRRAFDATEQGRNLLVRDGSGYRLDVAPLLTDVGRVDQVRAAARAAARAGESSRAVELLTRALSGGRRTLLAGLSLGPSLSARRIRVEEEELADIELLADLRTGIGETDAAIAALRELVSAHPLREHAHFLLVRALRQTGDAAGAVAAYHEARRILADQLGVEPGREFRQFYASLLDDEGLPVDFGGPSTDSAASRRGDAITDARSPINWLPRTVTDFVGRGQAVERLSREMSPGSAGPTVAVIDGMAGSGKTTLAVHLANLLAGLYPDGQLFLDLRGHGSGEPISPAAALFDLLRQLGVPANRIPAEFDARIEAWRRETAFRRVVVVLDNAAESAQVEPLLPSVGTAAILVTSRRRLLALTTRPPLSLPVLAEEESLELLAALVGKNRVTADIDGARQLVRRCGHLPLAIRLAGARLAHRATWSMSDMARRLDREPIFLPQLQAEDRTIVGAFAASYEPLSPSAKRVFRAVGLHPGNHLDTAMIAALVNLPLSEAAALADELVDRYLLEEGSGGSYRLHDLMRQYSSELALQFDTEVTRRTAMENLLDHFLHSVVQVSQSIDDQRLLDSHLRARLPRRVELLAVRRPGDLDWLEEQRLNLAALVRRAVEDGHDTLAWQLTRAGWRFFYLRGYFDDISITHQEGLKAARRSGDRAAVALMHNYLASALVRTASYREALAHLDQVVAIRTRLHDDDGTERARVNMSIVYWRLGRLQDALDVQLSMLRKQSLDTLPVLSNVGLILRSLGEYAEAARFHRTHLFLARTRQDLFQIANALGHLGGVRYRLGESVWAERLLRASLALRARTGHGFATAETLSDLAGTYRQLGRHEEALRIHRAAIESAVNCGERHAEAAALNELARTLLQMGRRAEAMDGHRMALDLATRIDHPHEQGRALAGLAECEVATDPDAACRYWQRALVLFEQVNVPEQHHVRLRLTNSPGPVG
ncbi:BTAD domain-containing putative transcriptional regulator [Micromonospora mangrovi]|uniref:BTAD domain-containing putative transcriptional regulator n=2 Tax=Micromonospora TaxID=1873 RepID=A0AAU8HAA6_9ACTN